MSLINNSPDGEVHESPQCREELLKSWSVCQSWNRRNSMNLFAEYAEDLQCALVAEAGR